MPDSQKMLRLEQVSKEYELKGNRTLKAVNEIDFSMTSRECVAIVGESGCGKSTLAKMITGIEPVTSGEIYFQEQAITHIQGEELRNYRKHVQMIFQDPSNVFSPRMKIGTFLMEPWRNFEKKTRKEAKDMAYYALERVNLGEDYFYKYPHQLSGGELQRISIARAIALHPQLLVCDEATSALDVSIQKQIIDLLREHQEEADFGILFISHDLALAEDFCDRVVVMYLGRIVEILEGKALRKHARHPYTKALLESVFSVHTSIQEPIKILPGEPPSPIDLPKGCAFCARCPHASKRCQEEVPQLKVLEGGHQAACHHL